jgi:hypothetical protein
MFAIKMISNYLIINKALYASIFHAFDEILQLIYGYKERIISSGPTLAWLLDECAAPVDL